MKEQFTAIGQVHSEIGTIITGIPQGSVLGPLLVLLYVYDIYNVVPGTKVKLFADDTNSFLHHKNITNLYSKANDNLELLSYWFITNKLSLSIDKTCYSVFGTQESSQDLELKINGRLMAQVQNCKYLGTYIYSICLGKTTLNMCTKNLLNLQVSQCEQ